MTFSLNLRGAGLITPLGDNPGAVWNAICKGNKAAVSELATTGGRLTFPVRRVPDDLCADVSRMPRLRRASPISNFAMAAAMRCLRDAGLEPGDLAGPDTALIFAASDGSVEYTRRFFEGVHANGPGQGSPLLFPETVYNAPASHVAAAIGLTGHTLSLVGDSAVAVEACAVAGQLLSSGSAKRVLVIAAEELDAIAVAGYASWGIAAASVCSPGVIFGEGAAALLLEKMESADQEITPQFSISVSQGKNFASLIEASRGLKRLLKEVLRQNPVQPSVIVGSNAGGGAARLETRLLKKILPGVDMIHPRLFLGDGLTAGSLWQIILAREILRLDTRSGTRFAVCPVTGNNGQMAVCSLGRKVE